jgi:hypothetical protein
MNDPLKLLRKAERALKWALFFAILGLIFSTTSFALKLYLEFCQ